ncbi:zinc ribbon domain-containing protein, partial [Chroococcidiopsis cubana CCALA 043]
MPLYEFRCDDCGVFDEWRSLAECNNPAHCPT